MLRKLIALPLLLLLAACATTPSVPPAAVNELAPGGKLRVAMNYGNVVLAQKDPATGEARGISADLARELAKRLNVPIEWQTYDTAAKVAEAAKTGAWDIGFLAIDPARAGDVEFTAPYVIIEGSYLVRADSPLKRIDEFDQTGLRIAVGQRTAYDLFLTRTLKKSTLVRSATSQSAIDQFVKDKLEAAAGVKKTLQKYNETNPGYRVIDGTFTQIQQAMGTTKGRPAGAAYLKAFVEEMKASGFVARGLAASGQTEAVVAPPAK
jgi:polar amino acid transport system substrate-binding protein